MQNQEQSVLKDKRFAAGFLGVSVAKIDRWCMTETGPAFVKLGRQVRFRMEDLEAFIRANLRGGKGATRA